VGEAGPTDRGILETGSLGENPHVNVAEGSRSPLDLRSKQVGQSHRPVGRKERLEALYYGIER